MVAPLVAPLAASRRRARPEAAPDIEIGLVYAPDFRDAPVQYGTFSGMADFFGRDTAAHRHDRFYQLHFIEAGHLNLRLDDQVYEADGPLLFLTPPSCPHAFRTTPDTTGHVITVARDFAAALFDDDPSLPRHARDLPVCLPLPGPAGRAAARRLTRLFRLLRSETELRGPGHPAAANALTRLILIEVFRLISPGPRPDRARAHDLAALRRFHDLVDRHHAEHWPVARYADSLAMTEARLTDLCNRLTGLTPKRAAHERLALQARRFLAFSRLPVNAIALALGFADDAYFCRFFRRVHGQTPSAWRARLAQDQGKVQSISGEIHSRRG